MVGRSHELAEVSALLERARHGSGAGIVVRGEPGVGKSLLLTAAVAAADGFTVLSAAGVQSESDLAFGALAALLRPLLEGINALPAVQADALRAAVGLSSAVHVEQITCFAAVVSLLAAAARTRPLIVVVDDLQWCDQGSRDAVFFAVRRLQSDPVAFVFGLRDGETVESSFAGLRELALGGLEETAALELVGRVADDVSTAVARRLWAQTAGNPLALTEIPRQLTTEQRSGRIALSEPLPVGLRLEESFAARASALPEGCRRALLVAAASYSGAADTIFDALAIVGLSPARARCGRGGGSGRDRGRGPRLATSPCALCDLLRREPARAPRCSRGTRAGGRRRPAGGPSRVAPRGGGGRAR